MKIILTASAFGIILFFIVVPLESPCFLWRCISFLKSFQELDFIKNLSLSEEVGLHF